MTDKSTCSICMSSIENDESYIVCDICQTPVHLECILEETTLECFKCHNAYHLPQIITHVNLVDMPKWVEIYMQKQYDIINDKLDFCKAVIDVHLNPLRNVNMNLFDDYCRLSDELSDIKMAFSSVQAYKPLYDEYLGKYLKLKDNFPEELYNSINDYYFEDVGTDFLQDVLFGETILDDCASELVDGEDENEYEFVTYGLRVRAIIQYIESNVRACVLKIGFHTDDDKINFLIQALSKGWFIDFNEDPVISFDEHGLGTVNKLYVSLNSIYPEFKNFMLNCPPYISYAFTSTTAYTFEKKIEEAFYNLAPKILKQKDEVKVDHPINICSKCKQPIGKDFKCVSCGTQYCNKCMKPLSQVCFQDEHGSEIHSTEDHDGPEGHKNGTEDHDRPEGHICISTDIDEWKFLQEKTKPCPVCGLRIEKLSGCDDMFCTNCHNGFNWDTMKIIEGSFHNPERQKWLEETKKSSTHLSPTFRQYPFKDRTNFFREISYVFKNRYYYFHNLCNISDELLSDMFMYHNDIYANGYTKRYSNENMKYELFSDEFEWFTTECMIRIGDVLETLNGYGTDMTTTVKFKHILEEANRFIDVIVFMINGCSAFMYLSSIAKKSPRDYIKNIQHISIQALSEIITMLRSEPTDNAIYINKSEFEKLSDAVNLDFDIKYFDVNNHQINTLTYISSMVTLIKNNREMRKNQNTIQHSLSMLSSVLNGDSVLSYIHKLIKEYKPSVNKDEITKIEVCFTTHYFTIQVDGNRCFYQKGGKDIALHISDLTNATIRFTIAGKAYKFRHK